MILLLNQHAVRHQAITWSNVDPTLSRIMVSLDHSELNARKLRLKYIDDHDSIKRGIIIVQTVKRY